jgi:circadian clock protein KaiC
MSTTTDADPRAYSLPRSPTGIQGLDEITGGGLPRGRPTLVSGSAGCGKTLMAMEFIVRGAVRFDEPGVFMAFEERADELAQNVRSLGFDVGDLVARHRLIVDHVHMEPSEIDETGEYDLDGLFVRLGSAIDAIGAKRVALDTIESLFSGLSNHAILRAELRRLFRWLKEKGVTAVITCERGAGTLTRYGLEEYVSDCVILLDHRVTDQVSTRRLRIVKYRGAAHGTDEYPFLIDESGIVVMPITSLDLHYPASSERVSTGVRRLDAMLGGKGFFRGSTVLVSGMAGTGRTSLAAHFAQTTCQAGERCLFVAFEESQEQLLRNSRSIGIDFEPWVKAGLLRFHASRPALRGLEMHLALIQKQVHEFEPSAVVVDSISNLVAAGTASAASAMLVRLIDLLKSRGITTLLTSLTSGTRGLQDTELGISSIVDTWLLVRYIEANGERNRGLFILKSRGMAHSNQIREFLLTDHGVELIDAYIGPEGVLTGSSRVAQLAREAAAALAQRQEVERKLREIERRRQTLDARIAALRAEFSLDEHELRQLIDHEVAAETQATANRDDMAISRQADAFREDGDARSGAA